MYSKSIKYLCLILLSLLVLSGCGANNESKATVSQAAGSSSVTNSTEKSITIAASFYPMYIFALNVAKDMPNVNVIDMTKPTAGCLHDYAATPADMKNLEGAKVLITNGAGMESFMDKITGQMPNLKIVDSSKGIPLIKGAGDVGDNPHVWVSISNAIVQVKNIGDQLSSLDPTNAPKYKENTNEYVKKLEVERDKMHQVLDGVKNRDIVTFHEAFPYFAKEFNLNIAGVIEREPGSEPSAKELAATIDRVKSLKVNALFAEPQYSSKAADTIAKETGAKIYTLDPVVTGPMEADAYLNIMDSNLKTLQEALK
ncbi:metal ABC transporter substrate-binding protein [Desulfosporosinus sp. Sb-LF]|uniref:metal ABC transporter substrate-binding protein n=1 Tax=Desulfosporosinus sp. Sb-LF TaxID=2560027 RepID=UPI00107F29AE|nr:metal ABC transporter substrate-binding protein [Desulfosporosinus sp. Sb-LF]TGE33666.1 zinc ABC transporter substrate-binding protein [Desulfosporosinus sp. Sb-LF]